MLRHPVGDILSRISGLKPLRPEIDVFTPDSGIIRAAEHGMNPTPSYEEIVDFIAAGTTPESVVAFRPTEAANQRVGDLIARSRDGVISSEEQAELDDYLQLEHLLILAKARARHNLQIAP